MLIQLCLDIWKLFARSLCIFTTTSSYRASKAKQYTTVSICKHVEWSRERWSAQNVLPKAGHPLPGTPHLPYSHHTGCCWHSFSSIYYCNNVRRQTAHTSLCHANTTNGYRGISLQYKNCKNWLSSHKASHDREGRQKIFWKLRFSILGVKSEHFKLPQNSRVRIQIFILFWSFPSLGT